MELPEDVIVQILNKLPLKSLIRFSCVSKRWFWLIITDQHVAKSHFRLASEQNSLTRRLLLLYAWDPVSQVESLDLESPDYSRRSLISPLLKFNPLRKFNCLRDILGSCNGLICLNCGFGSIFDVYIWNPSTRFFRILPDPGFSKEKCYILYSGFGYCSANDDYKVVVATTDVYPTDDPHKSEEIEVAIFSCRTGLWKRIDSPFMHRVFHPATLLREKLHWFYQSWSEPAIFAFDLATEEFLAIPLPHRQDSSHPDACATYGGYLYVHCVDWPANSTELWVMREYGVASTWTKLFNFKICLPGMLKTFMVMEASIVVANLAMDKDLMPGYLTEMAKIEYKDGQPVIDVTEMRMYYQNIMYEETLLRLPNYRYLVGDGEKVKETQNSIHGHPQLKSRKCLPLNSSWILIILALCMYRLATTQKFY